MYALSRPLILCQQGGRFFVFWPLFWNSGLCPPAMSTGLTDSVCSGFATLFCQQWYEQYNTDCANSKYYPNQRRKASSLFLFRNRLILNICTSTSWAMLDKVYIWTGINCNRLHNWLLNGSIGCMRNFAGFHVAATYRAKFWAVFYETSAIFANHFIHSNSI